MILKRLVFFISICFFMQSVNAQSSINISFGHGGINIPDTVSIGDSIWYSCWVVNNGKDVLAENIIIKSARYDASLGLVAKRTIGGQGPNFIYPNDSIQFVPNFLFEVVTNQNYIIGDNIVVIWPKADVPNSITQTNQYLYKNVHVLSNSMTTINELSNKNKKYFYPQPARDKIFFNSNEQITSINVFNMLGEKIAFYENITAYISIDDLPQGVFLLKIKLIEGGEKLQKLIVKR